MARLLRAPRGAHPLSGSTGTPLGSINWIDGVPYQANPFQDAGGLSVTFTGSAYLLGWAKSVTGSVNTFVGTLTTAGGQSGSVSVSTRALNWTTAVGYDGTNALLASRSH